MKRVAAIYDIHANLPALEAVIEEVRALGADHIVIGGDTVPGPMPRETLELLRELDIAADFIVGNGETAVLAELAGAAADTPLPEAVREIIRWTAEKLSPADRKWLGAWPATVTLGIDGLGEVLFCHATPRNEHEIFTRATREDRLLPVFEGVQATTVVCGHTHMQFDRTVGPRRVVNAGSVGLPFGSSGAYWLMLGPGVELRVTRYDIESAVEGFNGTDYPQVSQLASDLLEPRSETETLELFAAAELE